MASPSTLLLLLSLLFGSTPFVVGSNTTTLIRDTCRKTKYYSMCMSSIRSDPISTNATDAKSLAVIMVGAGAASATKTSSYLSSRLNRTNDVGTRKVLKECGDKYAYSADALRGSVQDLGDEAYDYAYVHVMAALDYLNACQNSFRRAHRSGYPQELAIREMGLRRICDVVLGIIDLLV